MAKSRDVRIDVKKKPAKSIKEKRKAKLEKKSKQVSLRPKEVLARISHRIS